MKNLSAEKLNLLLELSEILNSSLELSEVKKRAIESAMKTLDADAGSIMLLDTQTGELFFDTALGEKGQEIRTIRLPRGQGIGGWVVQNKKPVIINNVQEDKRFFKDADSKSGFKTINMMCAPLVTRHKMIGVLQIINKKDGNFTDDDLTLLIALSNQIAIAIENALLYEELRETFYSTIHALAEAVEKRDALLSGHTKRVTKYCMATAKELSLSAKDTINLKLAAILHDIGKITLSDRLLQETDPLKYHEKHLFEMHPIYGAEIISHIKSLKDIIPVIRYHHEKYNGSGYPDGLQGDDIPFLSRIISVADTFDIMSRQKKLSFENALKEIKDKSWVEFDGEIVMAFSIGLKKLQDKEEKIT
ncbi:MAG: GAF domain-containing protein [Thermodesulfovibrionales bacterium]|nr:GAF domain-containing protein [Thermodesulfovibrionales bacterium]